jgi:hypothetical protein
MKTRETGVLAAALFSAFLLGGCVVVPGPGGSDTFLVPALPDVVVLEQEPYYHYGGYQYYYRDDRWYYSRSRGGPWVELPRDRYPKETRFKGRGEERGRGEMRGYEEHGR